MYMRMIFHNHTISSNSKVPGVVLILKTWEQVGYLHVFCYEAIVMFISTYV